MKMAKPILLKIYTQNFQKNLAEICKNKKVKLIHLSALGLEKAQDSKYALSKISGEKQIEKIDAQCNYNKTFTSL